MEFQNLPMNNHKELEVIKKEKMLVKITIKNTRIHKMTLLERKLRLKRIKQIQTKVSLMVNTIILIKII